MKKNIIRDFKGRQNRTLLELLTQKFPNWNKDIDIRTVLLDASNEEDVLNRLLDIKNLSESGIRVLPTPMRLNVNPNYTGKGVTICLIDSGFFPHPDLILPRNRIKLLLDITKPNRPKSYFDQPHDNAWHGTMTSVVCAGNGTLSDGLYKGIASEAEVVLLKVSNENGAIPGENIANALQWVIKNHLKYAIRIVNLSVADDYAISFHDSEVDKAIKVLTDKGIIVVAAIGNDPHAPILPPANAPEVIAVGGSDDQNSLEPLQQTLYHSTYGWTVDGLLKPDLIAPAIWLAAPILPNTTSAKEAKDLFERCSVAVGIDKENILKEIKNRKLISESYIHTDGTSFAAPIVCSVIAQMLEANPSLTPEMTREILLTTARPLPNEEMLRQGYGVIQPANAVTKASKERHYQWIKASPVVDYEAGIIQFYFHYHDAFQVVLSGDFVDWSSSAISMTQQEDGIWEYTIPLLPKGQYQYKFVIDHFLWKTDPLNFYRMPDGYDGFNSRFFV